MTILVASVDALPQLGGISLMAHHLCNAFQRAGRDTFFLGPRGTCIPREYLREYTLIEDRESRTRERSGAKGSVQDRRVASLLSLITKRYGIQRILLLHPFYYALGALEVAKAENIKVSCYFHGFELRSQLKEGYPSIAQLEHRGTLSERVFFAATHADEVLVNSRYTGSLLSGFPNPPCFRVTGCGLSEEALERELAVSPSYQRSIRDARKAELGFTAAPLLAFVGRLVETKGISRLLSVCAASPDLQAILVGDGPARAALEAQVESLGLLDRVRLIGRVSETAKWNALRAADFGCLLSEPKADTGQVEGFGIALLEAAAAGAVPVTSGTGGMLDVVRHDVTGLVLPSDPSDSSEALLSRYRDPSRMAELIEMSRRQLLEEFTWGRVAGRITTGWEA